MTAIRSGLTRVNDFFSTAPGKVAFFFVLALVTLFLPVYFQSVGNAFMVRIFALVGIYALLALGLNIVVGQAGLLNLGFIAFYAVGAYAGMNLGFLMQELLIGVGFLGEAPENWSYWFILPFAAVPGVIAGLMIGTPVLRLRGDYLAIVTLGFGEIVRIAITNDIAGITNGASGLPGIGQSVAPAAGQLWVRENLSAGNFVFSKDLYWYYIIIALVLFAIFVINRIDNSRLGRAWVAMREDEVAASSVGVNILTTKLWAFALGAAWGGIAGHTYAYWVGFISPESFNFMESVLVVCMVVLGGMGSIPGTILGAVIITAVPEVIRALAASPALSGVLTAEQASTVGDYRFLIFGGLMVVMMALRPQGILPSKRRARELNPANENIRAQENQQLWEAEHKHNSDSDIL
ncbi:MAG: branched-chain amino acid ABC transporter permease [Clostridiales bacterium]|nr:branched-chain amino acid ABC transporter permease [Clostridiales bacterium]